MKKFLIIKFDCTCQVKFVLQKYSCSITNSFIQILNFLSKLFFSPQLYKEQGRISQQESCPGFQPFKNEFKVKIQICQFSELQYPSIKNSEIFNFISTYHCIIKFPIPSIMDTIGSPKESKCSSISRDKIEHTSSLGHPQSIQAIRTVYAGRPNTDQSLGKIFGDRDLAYHVIGLNTQRL